MNIDEDRIENFNVRMNDWLSKQGLLFQLKYSGGGGFFFSLWSLFIKLLVLCAILAVAGVVYLYLRVDKEHFQTQLTDDIGEYFKTEEMELKGVGHSREGLAIYSIEAPGNDSSFYEDLSLNGVKIKMGLASGLWKEWDAGQISVEGMDLKVKAGAGTDELASEAYAALFTEAKNTTFKNVKVLDATIRWGYTETTSGKILGTNLLIEKLDEEGWLLSMKGGTFQQNWLRGLTIDELVVEVKPEGIYITKAILSGEDGGSVEFTASIEEGGERPQLKGRGTATHLNLTHCIGDGYSDFAEGYFSGEFELGGSTNTQKGLEMTWKGELGENDQIVLWNKVPILKALTVFDPQRSYRKVGFEKGTLQFVTNDRTVQFTELDLIAKDLMRLRGHLEAKYPSREEATATLGYEVSDLLLAEGAESEHNQEQEELTLDKAGKAAAGEEVESLSIAGRGSSNLGDVSLKVDAMQRELSILRLKGKIDLGILPDALARYPVLEGSYPLDAETQMRWIELDISESIDSITKDTVDMLYKKAKGKASFEITE